MEEITNEALYAAIESIANSIGPTCKARMHMAIAQANQKSEAIASKPNFPEESRSLDELDNVARLCKMYEGSSWAWRFANNVLRHACMHGQVVPREAFDRAVGDRDARDMAVAKEVVKSLCWVLEPVAPERFNEDYLGAVIARVKP
jgi:hypothetical protein